MSRNRISHDENFKQTSLCQNIIEQPFGFIDVGALGGVHSVVDPLVGHVHALCFEADQKACEDLIAGYEKNSPYAKVDVIQTALGGVNLNNQDLYIQRAATNTSLLKPNPAFVQRYKAVKFETEKIISVDTQTLDSVLEKKNFGSTRMGELIKLDTQGSEYDILKGAENVLKNNCLGVFCEVEFFEVYENQKTYADIDRLLRDYGLVVYGLYPHYRSKKILDTSRYATEERLMWADAVFFKDPFDACNKNVAFSKRDLQMLILIALLTGFNDFALELTAYCYEETSSDRKLLEKLVESLSYRKPEILANELSSLNDLCKQSPDQASLLIAEFISKHSSNKSVEHLLYRNSGA